MQQQEQQALDAVQNARTEQQAAAPRQQYLTQVETVQDARPHVIELDRITGEVARRRQAVSAAESHLTEAQRVRQQADVALARATQAVAAAEQQRTDASAALNQARSLDAEIKTLAPGHESAAKALHEAGQAEVEARQRLEGKQTERQQVARQLQTAQDWLTRHQPLRILAEDWPRWDVLLEDATTLQNSLREAEQKGGFEPAGFAENPTGTGSGDRSVRPG